MPTRHTPVLLSEVLSLFSDRQIKTFLDCTLGLGGHAQALLEQHPEITSYVGCDQDLNALAIAEQRLAPWKAKLRILRSNFSELSKAHLPQFDGLLVDLGVSSLQLDNPERGFSFRREGPLDMRMDTRDPLTAADIVNTWSEADLGRIFREYGEEVQWRAASRAIVRARTHQSIETTLQLVELLMPLFPPHRRRKTTHPLTQIFQALRLCVNRELEVLKTLLPWAIDQLNPGGRLAVITFHSLEDRIVKQAFQHAASDKVDTSGRAGLFLDKTPTVKIVTRKPLECSEAEAAANPRARSAKLRAVEKMDVYV